MDDPSNLVAYATAGAPEHALPAIRRLRRLLDECEPARVADARAAGWTWGEIARVLGRSRQAMHRRYRHLPRGEAPTTLTYAELNMQLQRLTERRFTGEIDRATFVREHAALWARLA